METTDGFNNPIIINSIVFMYGGDGWEVAMMAYPDVARQELANFRKMANSIRVRK